tara:strand:+ start:846 stop:1742 length:897 start_codon:yes stop_codon:yes gene_type:complete
MSDNPQGYDHDAVRKPIWKEKPEDQTKVYTNEDTYQTIKEARNTTNEHGDLHLFVATPCHSEVSMHYVNAIISLTKACHKRNIPIEFSLIKSSLVTQGRNLCVSGFLDSKASHLLFIDSDIFINSSTIFKMVKADKDVISVPYPLKAFLWDKSLQQVKEGLIKTPEQLAQAGNTYPMRVPDKKDIQINNGVIEVTHSPTGAMLIKRSVFEKMIKAYPDKEIRQNTVINSQLITKKNMWNFFDTIHDPIDKSYLGEDFGFCRLWKDIGGKCHAYVLDEITHVGEHQYIGKFADELIKIK